MYVFTNDITRMSMVYSHEHGGYTTSYTIFGMLYANLGSCATRKLQPLAIVSDTILASQPINSPWTPPTILVGKTCSYSSWFLVYALPIREGLWSS